MRGAFVALLLAAAGFIAQAQTLSFTFDDGFDAARDPQAAQANDALLAALKRAGVQAMLFPAFDRAGADAGVVLVRRWADEGHAIGNHTASHRSLGSTRLALEDFIDDVSRADSAYGAMPTWQRRLRFPYLKEGNTAEKRDGMRAWMVQHGYRAAPVSIDTSDWYYNQHYLDLVRRNDRQSVALLKSAYLDHLQQKAAYYDALAVDVLKRRPAHVMLLHANAINAAWIGDVIDRFKASGWTIVNPLTAFADPLYERRPDTLPAGESVVWALAKEAGIGVLRYPAEDGDYEAPMLDALGIPPALPR